MKLNHLETTEKKESSVKKILVIPALIAILNTSPTQAEWIDQEHQICKSVDKNSFLYKKLWNHLVCSNSTNIPYTIKGRRLFFKWKNISLNWINSNDIQWISNYLKENNYAQAWKSITLESCYCDENWDLHANEKKAVKKTKETTKQVIHKVEESWKNPDEAGKKAKELWRKIWNKLKRWLEE